MDKMKNFHEQYQKLARRAIAEGCVLIKNDNEVLPIKKGSKVALFGRSQFNYYKSGTGSGGEVNTSYVTGVKEALEACQDVELNQKVMDAYEEWLVAHPFDKGIGWAQEPWFQEEMPLTPSFVDAIAQESDLAIVLIGRTAGEDKDNKNEEGSYQLTKQEKELLEVVCKGFEKTLVLLNVGNVIDMKWVAEYKPSAVMYIWQGGQEGGNGVLDVLMGTVTPCGRLSDTIAIDIEDYASTKDFGDEFENIYAEDIYVGYRYFSTFAPERVLYPFGYGLSYTRFDIQTKGTSLNPVQLEITVTNSGEVSGKETVLAFAEAPQGLLGKAKRVLVGYCKTRELAPGESQTLLLSVEDHVYASYDDSGVTGNKACFVLEKGCYNFFVGEDVVSATLAVSREVPELILVERLQEVLAPSKAYEVLVPGKEKADGSYELAYKPVTLRTKSPTDHRLENLPKEIDQTGNKGILLGDVKNKKASMEEFVGQFTDEELCCLVRGEGMCSPKGTPGTASVFGGVTDELAAYGLPVACCADGPSGIRMDCGTIAFSMPNGVCLACTFDDELLEELYEYEGLELRKNHIDTLLGPGMNIHRNPLNGRNFEYFSEDPFLTGKLAAAQLRGMNKYNVTGTIKHYACNNQEFNRHGSNSVVSERAFREIYLKGYEIAVKEGNAHSIMTTYGPVNGLWTAGNYDLVTKVLREDWGYTGIVMTDWWAKVNDEGCDGERNNFAAMVRAQNDLYMVTQDSKKNKELDNLWEQLMDGRLTRAELQRSAMNICNFLMNSQAFVRNNEPMTDLDKALESLAKEDSKATGEIIKIEAVNGVATYDGSKLDTGKGESTTLEIELQDKGYYMVRFRARAKEGTAEVAQMPVSLFLNKILINTITLSGTDTEWKEFETKLTYPIFHATIFLKLYFGMGGLEVDQVSFEFVEECTVKF